MKYNVKYIEPVMLFLFWLLCFVIISIIGISNVFALQYENVDGYQNNITVVLVAPDYSNSPINVPINSSLAFNQVREVIVQVDNFNFVANRNYQLELYLPQQDLGRANSYTVYGLNDESCLVSYDNSVFLGEYPRFAFQCSNSTNNITIHIKNSSNQILWDDGPNGAPIFTWGYSYLRYSSTSLSGSGIVTDDIINNQNENTQNIINNQNENTDKIISSNKETQEVIKDQFNSCRPSKNLWPLSTSYSTSTGNEYVLRDTPITIKPGTYTISFKNSSNTKVLFNFKDISGISKELYFENIYHHTITFSNEQVLTAIYIYDRPSTISEIQFQTGTTATKFEEPYTEICSNKIDETNDKLDGIHGLITDNTSPNTSGLENSAGWLPPGPLDSVLNLPLTMLNSLTNSLLKTCSPLNLTLPYVNKNLEIPCLSSIFAQITGVNSLWTWVGTIASVLILYNYLLNLYSWVDRVLTLRAEFDEAMGADLANWGRL